MDDFTIIKEVFTNVSKEHINKIERLMGGMSNFTYYFECDNNSYTFRIPGAGAENFVDRKIENAIIKSIAPLNFMPQPLYFDIETGYKIAPFVKGTVLNEITPKPYKEVADTLKKLHQSNKFDYDYKPLDRLTKYEGLIDNKDVLYHTLKDKWLEIYNNLLKNTQLVPCHGDSQVSNFIIDNKTVYLVDWEFAGNNDLYYDIACFGNANFEDALALLNAYFTNPTEEDYQKLYGWRIFQCLQWHNVAAYKHKIGLSDELMIDFDFFARVYLDKAKGFLKDYHQIKEGVND